MSCQQLEGILTQPWQIQQFSVLLLSFSKVVNVIKLNPKSATSKQFSSLSHTVFHCKAVLNTSSATQANTPFLLTIQTYILSCLQLHTLQLQLYQVLKDISTVYS